MPVQCCFMSYFKDAQNFELLAIRTNAMSPGYFKSFQNSDQWKECDFNCRMFTDTNSNKGFLFYRYVIKKKTKKTKDSAETMRKESRYCEIKTEARSCSGSRCCWRGSRPGFPSQPHNGAQDGEARKVTVEQNSLNKAAPTGAAGLRPASKTRGVLVEITGPPCRALEGLFIAKVMTRWAQSGWLTPRSTRSCY